jgi:hypothetical protein
MSPGCSTSKTAPVSGRITLDGQPLADAHITFQPVGNSDQSSPGMGSYARADSTGAYTLRLVESNQPGAVVGQHRVEINLRNDSSDDGDRRGKSPAAKIAIPAKYNRQSELTIEITAAGKTDANFDLSSK